MEAAGTVEITRRIAGETYPIHELLRELAPSTRRPIENLVFSGNWGETASLIEDPTT